MPQDPTQLGYRFGDASGSSTTSGQKSTGPTPDGYRFADAPDKAAAPASASTPDGPVESVAKGAAKALATMGVSLPQFVDWLSGATGKRITERLGVDPNIYNKAQQSLEPHGTGEQIGSAVANIGTAFIPAGAIETLAAEAGVKGVKLLDWLAPKAPKMLSRLAAMVPRAAVQGAAGAAVNAAQGGKASTGAAMGAGASVAGDAVKAVAPKAAELLVKLGLQESKSARAEFPNSAARAVAEGLPLNLTKIQARLKDVESELTKVVTQAPPSTVKPNELADQAAQYVRDHAKLDVRSGGFAQDKAKELAALQKKFLKRNRSAVSNEELLDLKRAEQADAKPSAYTKKAIVVQPSAIETLWHKGLADASRAALVKNVPRAEDILLRQQQLLGLKSATVNAVNTPRTQQRVVAALSALDAGWLTGNPQAGAAIGAVALAAQSPTLMGAMSVLTKKLGADAPKLLPIVGRALLSLYPASSGSPQPSQASGSRGRGGS